MSLGKKIKELSDKLPYSVKEAAVIGGIYIAAISAILGFTYLNLNKKEIKSEIVEEYNNVVYHIPTSEAFRAENRKVFLDSLVEPEETHEAEQRKLKVNAEDLPDYCTEFSENRKRAVVYLSSDNFCLVDVESNEVLYEDSGRVDEMNPDASMIVYRVLQSEEEISGPEGLKWVRTYNYYRADIKKNTRRKVAQLKDRGTFTYSPYILSPDGNLLVLPRKYKRDFSLEKEIRVYDHSKRELVTIGTYRMGQDVKVSGITNDEVLITEDGKKLDYNNAYSVWISPNREWMKGPVVKKEVLEWKNAQSVKRCW